jgi:hypothetical protein
MGELEYSFLVVAGIVLTLAGFFWSWRNHSQMSRALGLFGCWGMAIPTTRTGMCLAMSGIVMLGLASLPPALLFYPDTLRALPFLAAGSLIGVGLVIDLVCWSEARPGGSSPGQKAPRGTSGGDPRRLARDRRWQR